MFRSPQLIQPQPDTGRTAVKLSWVQLSEERKGSGRAQSFIGGRRLSQRVETRLGRNGARSGTMPDRVAIASTALRCPS